jgi:hypothetical protein
MEDRGDRTRIRSAIVYRPPCNWLGGVAHRNLVEIGGPPAAAAPLISGFTFSKNGCGSLRDSDLLRSLRAAVTDRSAARHAHREAHCRTRRSDNSDPH